MQAPAVQPPAAQLLALARQALCGSVPAGTLLQTPGAAVRLHALHPVQFAAVYPHKKFQDPKVRLLLDFMAERCQRLIKDILAGR